MRLIREYCIARLDFVKMLETLRDWCDEVVIRDGFDLRGMIEMKFRKQDPLCTAIKTSTWRVNKDFFNEIKFLFKPNKKEE